MPPDQQNRSIGTRPVSFFPDDPPVTPLLSLTISLLFFVGLSQLSLTSHTGPLRGTLTESPLSVYVNVIECFFWVFGQNAKPAQYRFLLLQVPPGQTCLLHSFTPHERGYHKCELREWMTSRHCWAFVSIWDGSSMKAPIQQIFIETLLYTSPYVKPEG